MSQKILQKAEWRIVYINCQHIQGFRWEDFDRRKASKDIFSHGMKITSWCAYSKRKKVFFFQQFWWWNHPSRVFFFLLFTLYHLQLHLHHLLIYRLHRWINLCQDSLITIFSDYSHPLDRDLCTVKIFRLFLLRTLHSDWVNLTILAIYLTIFEQVFYVSGAKWNAEIVKSTEFECKKKDFREKRAVELADSSLSFRYKE